MNAKGRVHLMNKNQRLFRLATGMAVLAVLGGSGLALGQTADATNQSGTKDYKSANPSATSNREPPGIKVKTVPKFNAGPVKTPGGPTEVATDMRSAAPRKPNAGGMVPTQIQRPGANASTSQPQMARKRIGGPAKSGDDDDTSDLDVERLRNAPRAPATGK